jgi:hypothetical protein
MMVNVLLVGLKAAVVDAAREQLGVAGVEFSSATDLDDVRAAFADRHIDHLVMGAGLDLPTRLEIVHEVFTPSDDTTVHLKDRASGPDGFLPFARSIAAALSPAG